jgi:hypothetical protein
MLAMGDAVNYVARILWSHRVEEAFIDGGNKEVLHALRLWLKDTATGEVVSKDMLSKVARHLRTGFTTAVLGWNLSTALIQPTGWLQTVTVLGPRYSVQGVQDLMKGDWTGDNSIFQQVYNLSTFMRERAENASWSKDVADAQKIMRSAKGVWGKLPDGFKSSFFYLIAKSQLIVDHASWLGAFAKGKAEYSDTAQAVEFADSVVRRSQASGLWSDRAAIERGTLSNWTRQSEFVRLFTPLMSYMVAKGSNAYEFTGRTDFKDPAQVMQWGGKMSLLFTVEALLVSAMRGGFPDPDDDESIPGWMLKESIFAAGGTLPLLRDLTGAAEGFKGGGGVWATFIYHAQKLMTQMKQGEIDRAMLKAALDIGGTTFKVPAVQPKRIADWIWRTSEGEEAPVWEAVVGRRWRR